MNETSFLNVALMLAAIWIIKLRIKESEKKIMSALKDTLEGLTAKLTEIDDKVKALVAAAGNDTLAPETQAALDALSAEVATVGTDSGVL